MDFRKKYSTVTKVRVKFYEEICDEIYDEVYNDGGGDDASDIDGAIIADSELPRAAM